MGGTDDGSDACNGLSCGNDICGTNKRGAVPTPAAPLSLDDSVSLQSDGILQSSAIANRIAAYEALAKRNQNPFPEKTNANKDPLEVTAIDFSNVVRNNRRSSPSFSSFPRSPQTAKQDTNLTVETTNGKSDPFEESPLHEATATISTDRVIGVKDLASRAENNPFYASTTSVCTNRFISIRDLALRAADSDKRGNLLFGKKEYNEAFLWYQRASAFRQHLLHQIRTKYNNNNNNSGQTTCSAPAAAEERDNPNMIRSSDKRRDLVSAAKLANMDEYFLSNFKSFQMKRDMLGPDHLSVGTALNNVGSGFYLRKQYGPALTAYREALNTMKARLGGGDGRQHLDLATVISNIGDVHKAAGRVQDALEKYHEALNIRWSQLRKDDPKVTTLLNRITNLEVGEMKLIRSADESEYFSDDSDYGSDCDENNNERRRQKSLHEEFRLLHDDLDDDMRFVDLIKEKMADEMNIVSAGILQHNSFVGANSKKEVDDEDDTNI